MLFEGFERIPEKLPPGAVSGQTGRVAIGPGTRLVPLIADRTQLQYLPLTHGTPDRSGTRSCPAAILFLTVIAIS